MGKRLIISLLIDLTGEVRRIAKQLDRIERKEDAMAMDLSQLEAAVKADEDTNSSAIKLLKGLADQIAALKPDKAAIDALAAKLRSNAETLSAAVLANTPADPSAPAAPADPNAPPATPA